MVKLITEAEVQEALTDLGLSGTVQTELDQVYIVLVQFIGRRGYQHGWKEAGGHMVERLQEKGIKAHIAPQDAVVLIDGWMETFDQEEAWRLYQEAVAEMAQRAIHWLQTVKRKDLDPDGPTLFSVDEILLSETEGKLFAAREQWRQVQRASREVQS